MDSKSDWEGPIPSARATNQILRRTNLLENKKIKTFVYRCDKCEYAEEHEMPLKCECGCESEDDFSCPECESESSFSLSCLTFGGCPFNDAGEEGMDEDTKGWIEN